MPFSLDAHRQTFPLSEEEEERLNDLISHQRELGMEPRDDSFLTYLYVSKQVNLTVKDAAEELVLVDYFYNHTPYGRLIEETMKHVASHIKKTYRITWTQTWNLVRLYVPTMLKLICADAKRLPSFYPPLPFSPPPPLVSAPVPSPPHPEDRTRKEMQREATSTGVEA